VELEQKVITEVSTPRGRYYETPAGCFPSVTNVLSSKDNPELDAWRQRVGDEEADRISREATNRGSRMHDLFESYLRGKEISFPHPTIKEHFLQVKKELDKIELIYANEIPLYSKYLKVAGRCDCIGVVDGIIKIIDFKTSKHFKVFEQIESYRMQCAAYAFMANEIYDLKINKFSVIITNLYENASTVFEGDARESIKAFWELRQKWDMISTNS
jgi:genome maintenance exonuclease 1